jgi:hypothetical protein
LGRSGQFCEGNLKNALAIALCVGTERRPLRRVAHVSSNGRGADTSLMSGQ